MKRCDVPGITRCAVVALGSSTESAVLFPALPDPFLTSDLVVTDPVSLTNEKSFAIWGGGGVGESPNLEGL